MEPLHISVGNKVISRLLSRELFNSACIETNPIEWCLKSVLYWGQEKLCIAQAIHGVAKSQITLFIIILSIYILHVSCKQKRLKIPILAFVISGGIQLHDWVYGNQASEYPVAVAE